MIKCRNKKDAQKGVSARRMGVLNGRRAGGVGGRGDACISSISMLSLRKSQQFQHDPSELAGSCNGERMELEAAARGSNTGQMGKRKSSFSQQNLGASAGSGLQVPHQSEPEASSSAPSHKVTVHDRKRDVLRAMQRILTPRKSKFDSNNEGQSVSDPIILLCFTNVNFVFRLM
ncbi:hypothetical protein Tco_0355817 [Tanacetum coccineum]